MMAVFKFIGSSLLATTLAAVAVLADDAVIQEKLDAAKALYSQRDAAAPEKTDQALAALSGLADQAEDSDLKYDVLMLTAHVHYWQGCHVEKKDEKMRIFDLGMKASAAAKELNPDYSDAYYLYAINLGKWANANGILESLSRKNELINNAKWAMENPETGAKRFSRDEKPGVEFDGFGPYRVLGRVYRKLPPLLGRDLKESAKLLEQAHRFAPDYALNTVYYAATLFANKDKKKATEILNELLKRDSSFLNPARLPESKEALKDAQRLLDEQGEDGWL